MARPLAALLVLMSVFTPATAQVSIGPGMPFAGASVADQHRYETERLHQQSQEQVRFARQAQLDARLTRQALQAARPPAPYVPLQPLVAQTPEAARRNREAVASGATQIDAWLARPPR